jgi:Putative transposase
MTTIAADPKHLGARIDITAVLHTWGSALTHHPHVHMIVPGGGIPLDGTRWVSCGPDFIPPVEILSCLFRGLFLAKLVAAHRAGRLEFFGVRARFDNFRAKAYLAPLRNSDWVVYAKRPFGGRRAVLAYLSRYAHRVGKTMRLTPHEFIRRFLMHVLPAAHRIRHLALKRLTIMLPAQSDPRKIRAVADVGDRHRRLTPGSVARDDPR